MADFGHFGGSDEENAEIKRLRADVVCLLERHLRTIRLVSM